MANKNWGKVYLVCEEMKDKNKKIEEEKKAWITTKLKLKKEEFLIWGKIYKTKEKYGKNIKNVLDHLYSCLDEEGMVILSATQNGTEQKWFTYNRQTQIPTKDNLRYWADLDEKRQDYFDNYERKQIKDVDPEKEKSQVILKEDLYTRKKKIYAISAKITKKEWSDNWKLKENVIEIWGNYYLIVATISWNMTDDEFAILLKRFEKLKKWSKILPKNKFTIISTYQNERYDKVFDSILRKKVDRVVIREFLRPQIINTENSLTKNLIINNKATHLHKDIEMKLKQIAKLVNEPS